MRPSPSSTAPHNLEVASSNLASAPSLCDFCTDPGRCCRRMTLQTADSSDITFWDDEMPAVMTEWLDTHGLPFEVLNRAGAAVDPDSGRSYSWYEYGCTKVTAAGRCSVYDSRPELCRQFEAGSNDGTLCVFAARRWVA